MPGLSNGKVVDDRWRVVSYIRDGKFQSSYYQVTDLQRPIRSLTMKIESNVPPGPDEPPRFLVHEKNMLKTLREKSAKYFIGLFAYGDYENFSYIVINTTGPNLDELRQTVAEKRFTLRTCLHVARRSLMCIEELHDAGFIHRDIKPANMFIGSAPDELRQLYIGNNELFRKYVTDDGHLHNPRSKIAFRGSPRYASVSALEEHEQSRADDMWAWLFSMIEIMMSKLPWNDTQGPTGTTQFLNWLAKEKAGYLQDSVHFLKGCPREFSHIFEHIKTLRFFDEPNYHHCLKLINETIQRKNYNTFSPLEWEMPLNVNRTGSRTQTHATHVEP